MKEIDMSSEAITRRLRQVSELRDLCLSLAKAKPLTKEEAIELRARNRAERDAANSKSLSPTVTNNKA